MSALVDIVDVSLDRVSRAESTAMLCGRCTCGDYLPR